MGSDWIRKRKTGQEKGNVRGGGGKKEDAKPDFDEISGFASV
jgi:hypothetical protein